VRCRCARTDAGGAIGREALDCRRGGERQHQGRRSVAMPSTRRAAAPGPMPVARSAARPLMPARWRAAPASSPARRSTAKREPLDAGGVPRPSTCPAAAPGPMPVVRSDDSGTSWRLVLHEVERLRATEFLEGNTILDVNRYSGSVPPLELIRSLFGIKSPNDTPKYMQERIARIQSGELTLFYIAPSYGCEFIALCGSVETLKV
jgi:hypothetical protein